MKKPSKIKCVKAKKAIFLLPNFRAITLFGIVYCRSERDVSDINSHDYIDSNLKNHETIHVRQAEGTKNSWFLFYLNYLWQWICNMPLIFVNINAPYKFIPFELEAYRNQNDWGYSQEVHKGWKKYKKLKLKDKRKFAKMYYKSKIVFSDFIEKYIDTRL